MKEPDRKKGHSPEFGGYDDASPIYQGLVGSSDEDWEHFAENGPDDLLADGDDVREGVDLKNAKAFELAFRADLIAFMTDLNFTRSADEVFDLVLRQARAFGFKMVVYEYTDDYTVENPQVYTRSNLPAGMMAIERWFRRSKTHAYGRRHCGYKWTPGVSGAAFVDMYEEYPEYQRKLKLAQIMPGVTAGIGVPLRSPDPRARAGISFSGKMTREECLAFVKDHGPTLTTMAWTAHIRILQHMNEARMADLSLTERQVQYLRHLADGLLDKQIAHAMGISHAGVRKHMQSVSRKLGVKRRSEIVSEARRRGILPDPEFPLEAGEDRVWDVQVPQNPDR